MGAVGGTEFTQNSKAPYFQRHSECHMNECSHLRLYFLKNSLFRPIHLDPGKISPTLKVTLYCGERWRH